MSSPLYTPEDALRLWNDASWLGRACDVYVHPGYSQARQTTRCFGRLLIEELADLGGVAGLSSRVAALISLPLWDFATQIPPVEVKSVPKGRVPADVDAGDDSITPVEIIEEAQRPIVVSPLIRRALSIHLSEILDATGDRLLPKEAIAYRPGRKRVVQNAILDAARAVRGGCSHWAKLDVRNFFPSVPWAGIEACLKRHGYHEEFVERVMALIKGGLAQRSSWRSWVPVENGSGTQAGLRESAVIANLFLSDLDRRVLGKFGKSLYYRRYSDDMLLMGRNKEVVRQAVVEIENWIESQGLTLKDVCKMGRSRPSRRDARSLVHAVSKRRIEFLGAEVNSLAHVYIPRKKVTELEAKAKHQAKYDTTMEEDIYVGFSKFATFIPRGEQRGRYRFDSEDQSRCIRSFKKYWEDLATINLGATMNNLFELIPLMGIGSDPVPHPWVACLGGLRARQGARPGGLPGSVSSEGSEQAVSLLSKDRIRSAWEADPIRIRIFEDDFDTQDDSTFQDGPLGMSRSAYVNGVGPHREGSEEADSTCREDWNLGACGEFDESVPTEESTEEELDSLEDGDQPEGASSVGSVRDEEGDRSGCYLHQWTGEACSNGGGEDRTGALLSRGDRSSSSSEDEVSKDSSLRFPPGSPNDNSLRESASRYDPAPSPQPLTPEGWVLRKRDIYVGTRYDPDRRCHRIAWQVCDDDSNSACACTQHTPGLRLETALLRVLIGLTEQAAYDGIGLLVFRVETNRLSKSLLQRTGAVRSPMHFEMIRRLHRTVADLAIHVMIGGPSQLPRSVIRKLEDNRGG